MLYISRIVGIFISFFMFLNLYGVNQPRDCTDVFVKVDPTNSFSADNSDSRFTDLESIREELEKIENDSSFNVGSFYSLIQNLVLMYKSLGLDEGSKIFIQEKIVPSIFELIDRMSESEFISFLLMDLSSSAQGGSRDNIKRKKIGIKEFVKTFNFDNDVYSYKDKNSFVIRAFKLFYFSKKNNLKEVLSKIEKNISKKTRFVFFEIHRSVIASSYLYHMDYFGTKRIDTQEYLSVPSALLNLILSLKIWDDFNGDQNFRLFNMSKNYDNNLWDLWKRYNSLSNQDKICFIWYILQDYDISQTTLTLLSVSILNDSKLFSGSKTYDLITRTDLGEYLLDYKMVRSILKEAIIFKSKIKDKLKTIRSELKASRTSSNKK